jgi:flagellar biosynthetic protein FliR
MAEVNISQDQLIGFLLVMVRVGSFMFVAPPFNGRTIPALIRVPLAAALSLPLAANAIKAADGDIPSDTPAVVGAIVLQVVIGVALGAVVFTILSAIQAAGSLIDLAGGFQLSSAYDPMLNQQNSVMGRLFQMLTAVLLLVSGSYALILRGMAQTFESLPLGAGLDLGNSARVMTGDLTSMFLATLQIAGPLVGVMLIADISLGLMNKVAPALNAFSLGFPLKIGLTLLLVGFTLPLLSPVLTGLTEQAVFAMRHLTGG